MNEGGFVFLPPSDVTENVFDSKVSPEEVFKISTFEFQQVDEDYVQSLPENVRHIVFV